MFRTGTTSVRMLQAVSLLASVAILMWSLGLPTLSLAEAASLTSVSDTLSDSDIGVVSNHTIRFTVPAGSPGLLAAETLTVTFPNGFNIATSGVDFTDVDFVINGTNQALADSPAGATWGATTTGSGQNLLITSGTGVLSANDTVAIYVGTHASSGVTGDQQVTNHGSAGSYQLSASYPADTGYTHVVILDDVTVTAAVDTVFDFTVSGFTTQTGISINGTSTTGTSSATEIPFGTLGANDIATIAQRLNVSTNASNGFTVTVQQSSDLVSATGADINSFIDGAYTDSPTAWQSPAAEIGTTTSYGHWGITSSDDLNGDEFGSDLWVAASTTPRAVFHSASVADGVTANIGSTTIGYQVEISSLQEAADDYSTEITYVATPVF